MSLNLQELTKKQLSEIAQAVRVNPVFFAEKFLGINNLEEHQKKWLLKFGEMVNNSLAGIPTKRRLAFATGHGCGKSFTLAIMALWFHYAFHDSITLITAPTGRQGKFITWAKIKQFHENAPFPLGGECLETMLKSQDPEHMIMVFTSQKNQSAAQGFHAPRMLVIVDEATGVDPVIFNAISGYTTSPSSFLILSGNAFYDPTLEFCKAFTTHTEMYETFQMSSYDSPFVSQEFLREAELNWGKESPLFSAKVLGQFKEDLTENRVFSLAILQRQIDIAEIDLPPNKTKAIGVDVARFGSDKTVYAIRIGSQLLPLETHNKQDLMQTSGQIINLIKQYGIPAEQVRVDVTGVGGGVVDRLHEQGFYVVPVEFGGKPIITSDVNQTQTYKNIRAQMYFTLQQLLKEGRIKLPDDNLLVSELSSIKYEFTSTGSLQIQAKDKLKEDLGRSPDRADAVALACADFLGNSGINRIMYLDI